MTSPRDFGWWIESTDEETYGPVTRATLTKFLSEGVISPNTAVKHCTQAKFAPAADQGLTDSSTMSSTRRTGDTLSEVWPKKTKDRLALAESDVECAYHRRPAILTCIRCLAPYCDKCRMKSGKRTYFMCKKCQGSIYNRRVGAYLLDNLAFVMLPVYGIGIPAVIALGPETGGQIINLLQFSGLGLFVFRDPIFKSASPGKRLLGLKVVKHEDGVSPLTFGQGFVRNLAHIIPFFNLVDAHVCYGDPYQRRFGDVWAKTRVVDTETKLERCREKVRNKLEAKIVEMSESDRPIMTVQEFARID